MNILIISQGYWPEIFPINIIAKNIVKSKINVNILTGYPNYPKGKIYNGFNSRVTSVKKKNNITINRVPIIPRGINSKFGIILNYISFLLSSIIFAPFLIKIKKIDIILVYATSPIIQAYVGIYLKLFNKNAKLITWVQDLWPNILKETKIIKNNYLLKIISIIVKDIYNRSDIILAQSKSFFKEIKKITSTKVHLVYNPGFDESELKFKRKKDITNILYAGNIGNAQPWEKLLNYLYKSNFNDKLKLTICGDGQKKNYVRDFIKQNKLKNIYLKNFLKDSNLKKEYQDADFLLIMLNDGKYLNKTIPSKFQTYLAKSKPLLGISTGEFGKLIKIHNLGLVLKLNSLNSFKIVCKKIIRKNNQDLNLYSKNAKKLYRTNFSQKIINKKLIKIFKKCIKKES